MKGLLICQRCNGSGQIVVDSRADAHGGHISYGICPACHGLGYGARKAETPMERSLFEIMRETIAVIARDDVTLEQAKAMCAHALQTVDRTTSALPEK